VTSSWFVYSSTVLPHVYVGDEAFVLSTHIMRPYYDKKLSIEKVCNFRQGGKEIYRRHFWNFK
jgi:hypothetical protein